MDLVPNVITSSTIIDATPEQIWDFFNHIEDKYEKWHDDHDFWRWTKGEPLDVGLKIDSQEPVGGHKGGKKPRSLSLSKTKNRHKACRASFFHVPQTGMDN